MINKYIVLSIFGLISFTFCRSQYDTITKYTIGWKNSLDSIPCCSGIDIVSPIFLLTPNTIFLNFEEYNKAIYFDSSTIKYQYKNILKHLYHYNKSKFLIRDTSGFSRGLGYYVDSINVEQILIHDLISPDVDIHLTNSPNIGIWHVKAKRLYIEGGNHINFEIELTEDSLTNFTVLSGDSVNLELNGGSVKNLELSYLKHVKNVSFSATGLPDHIKFQNLDLTQLVEPIDMSNFNHLNHICLLTFINTDISKFKFNYFYFKLDTAIISDDYNSKDIDKASKIRDAYTKIIATQQSNGYFDGFEKAEIEFKQYNYLKDLTISGKFRNWLDNNWQNYGFDKSLIFRNSLILLLFFFILNLIWYPKLLNDVYTIKEFKKAAERGLMLYANDSAIRTLSRIGYCFLYTCYIFWGLKLDVEKIKLKHPILVFLLLLQYLVGIVCLAYIANLVITK